MSSGQTLNRDSPVFPAKHSGIFLKKSTTFVTVGKMLSSIFGIQKLSKGKFLNYFVGISFGNFSGN